MSSSTDSSSSRLKRPLLYVMSLAYVFAGVMHFVSPKMFARIVPPQLPRPVFLVYLSGVVEIVLGIGVLFRRTRRLSAWGLIGLLLAVFPANVYMATSGLLPDAVPDDAERLGQAALWARLPLQGVLVLWAWWYTQDD
ncbi:hypothetical protein AUR64_02465 [Haloprofundus marisrubri]|uniref:DoxX family protein n=1 Tax=Haloprofundus marisrubri TaxID=1514971 RepID=A0A0W1R3L8_9EURY|nr:DoxX-like family protein [Haloprofundus marisrubri]KTG07724.1 hypothetical protein AUR64_02465 [Haloprofundus marisrubri]